MFVIGTAGHVDHGKSLLVERLTGIDPDRLQEEKQRGMTIDLGFAWLTLPSGRTVSLVDVPGHERFIRNMLAGAGGIDLALLVVAADDGVMPQTREHLDILDLLGVSRGVVALTKCDLAAADWRQLVTADINELLRGTALEGAPLVPCSALTGEGIDELVDALDHAIADLPAKRSVGRPRLPIDRVFTIGGFGTVVTGTLIDGELAVGDDVEVLPGGTRGRIRGLQTHRERVEGARPGTRTAVNLAGVERDALRRGLVMVRPGTARPTQVVDARVRVVRSAPHPLRHNMRLSFHWLADETEARLRLLEDDAIAPGHEGWAQLRLAAPIAAVRGDRFVLRMPGATVAGGVIVDTAPKRHRRGDRAMADALAALSSERPEDAVYAAVSRRPFLRADELAAEMALPLAEAETALAELVEAGSVVQLGDGPARRYITLAREQEVHARTVTALREFHERHPLDAGMPIGELRSRLGVDGAALAMLAGRWEGVVASSATASLASFAPTLSGAHERQAAAFLASLRAAPFTPPRPDGIDPALLAYLARRGDIVDAGDGVVFSAEAFAEIRRRVEEHIVAHGAITLAQARDELGASRRYVQSALEHLDRLRVTVRRGDDRILRQDARRSN